MRTLHRDARSAVPELLDWLESPLMTLRPYLAQPIRVEDFVADGRYVVRAELAGFDPEKEIDVTVGPGFLTIHAERSDESEGRHRSEFRYGKFTRTVALPADADSDDVTGRLPQRHPDRQHRPEERRAEAAPEGPGDRGRYREELTFGGPVRGRPR